MSNPAGAGSEWRQQRRVIQHFGLSVDLIQDQAPGRVHVDHCFGRGLRDLPQAQDQADFPIVQIEGMAHAWILGRMNRGVKRYRERSNFSGSLYSVVAFVIPIVWVICST